MKQEIEIFRGKEGLDAIAPVWRELQAKLPNLRFFHRVEWYKARLAVLEQDPDSVYFFLVSTDGQPSAIFPLRYATTKRYGIPLVTWELYWPNDMGVCDGICVESASATNYLKILVRWLRKNKAQPWDVFRLQDTPEDSNIMAGLKVMNSVCALSILHHYSKHIPCNADYDTVMNRLSGHFRRNVRRQAKKINELGNIEFRFVSKPEELAAAFAGFLEAEASSWKGEEGSGTAVALSSEITAFYRVLIDAMSVEDGSLVALIVLDGRCIAAQLALRVNKVIYLLKIGYDHQYQALGPGNVLLGELIKRYSAEVNSISFVTGARWNDNWSPETINVYDNYIFNYTPPGMALCIVEKVKDHGRRIKHLIEKYRAEYQKAKPVKEAHSGG